MFLKKRILISITGKTHADWQSKLKELEKLKIRKCALFLECYTKTQRKKIFEAILSSNIKRIPFVHARHDMTKPEFEFLIKNFHTKYFNIHRSGLKKLKHWPGLKNKLLLEIGFHNFITKEVKVEKVAGFCIDLSHFKASEQRLTNEYTYTLSKRKQRKLFKANHLNGYSQKFKKDLHTIKSLKEFDYLKTIPKFLFGRYIALETWNPIKEQLKFKEYVAKLLKNK